MLQNVSVDESGCVLDADTRELARRLSNYYSAEGFVDHHIHADRVGTGERDLRYFEAEGGNKGSADATLVAKQDNIGVLHRGDAFKYPQLLQRLSKLAEWKIAAGEKCAYFIVDCSPDIDGRAFRAALEVREKYKNRIDIKVGLYPIFGIKEWGSDRWQHLLELAPRAQFVMGLPERDARGDHPVGFDGHLGLLYDLATEHRLPFQVHVDQTNTAGEDGTQRLISCIRMLSARVRPEDRPEVTAVHVLIDGKEDEERVQILQDLKSLNMRVISCLHAGASMRQRRDVRTPTHSSIAPIRECLLLGIPVGLGTDNRHDNLMPLPTMPLLLTELDAFGSLTRFYDEAMAPEHNVLWKVARGEALSSADRGRVAKNIAADYEAFGLKNPWLRWMTA